MVTLQQIRTATDGAAWKTGTMTGYLFKTVLDPDTYGRGAFTLTFRESKDDDNDTPSDVSDDTPVDHVFYFDVDATKSETAASVVQGEVDLDFELLGHVLSSQWVQGRKEDFEIVRHPGSRKW